MRAVRPVSYTHLFQHHRACDDAKALAQIYVKMIEDCLLYTSTSASEWEQAAMLSHEFKTPLTVVPVSYTHLDVYKRQPHNRDARDPVRCSAGVC